MYTYTLYINLLISLVPCSHEANEVSWATQPFARCIFNRSHHLQASFTSELGRRSKESNLWKERHVQNNNKLEEHKLSRIQQQHIDMKNNNLFRFFSFERKRVFETQNNRTKNAVTRKSGKPLWSSVMGHTKFDLKYSNIMVMCSLGQWNPPSVLLFITFLVLKVINVCPDWGNAKILPWFHLSAQVNTNRMTKERNNPIVFLWFISYDVWNMQKRLDMLNCQYPSPIFEQSNRVKRLGTFPCKRLYWLVADCSKGHHWHFIALL